MVSFEQQQSVGLPVKESGKGIGRRERGRKLTSIEM